MEIEIHFDYQPGTIHGKPCMARTRTDEGNFFAHGDSWEEAEKKLVEHINKVKEIPDSKTITI